MKIDPRTGAKSLIKDAVGARSGETLAIVAEDPRLGIYDALVPQCVMDVAEGLGVKASIIPVGNHAGLDEVPEAVDQALRECDHVLFQARIGDTLRFSDIPGSATKTMSYALDIGILGGPACTIPHAVMEDIRAAYDAKADTTHNWRINCPLGTNISGTQDVNVVSAGLAEDFTVTRYPVCAPRPLPCNTATGVVVLSRFLMASGNRVYPDDVVMLREPIRAHIENGKITDFEGNRSITDKVRAQYERVGELFDLDPYNVHSWHAGMNPGTFYPVRAEKNIERWGKVAFANPRYLHFHTCGNYAPGEVAWSIFDASATYDGVDFWRDGRFVFLESDEVREILDKAGIDQLEIRTDIGIDETD